jgi:hypothetical protein
VHRTYRWIVEGDRVLGAIALRHELNDFLLRAAGNIGDGIRPSARRRGLARLAGPDARRGARARPGRRSRSAPPSWPARSSAAPGTPVTAPIRIHVEVKKDATSVLRPWALGASLLLSAASTRAASCSRRSSSRARPAPAAMSAGTAWTFAGFQRNFGGTEGRQASADPGRRRGPS